VGCWDDILLVNLLPVALSYGLASLLVVDTLSLNVAHKILLPCLTGNKLGTAYSEDVLLT